MNSDDTYDSTLKALLGIKDDDTLSYRRNRVEQNTSDGCLNEHVRGSLTDNQGSSFNQLSPLV